MKTTLEKILKILARAIFRKYRPEVIAITGSVGKTTARQAIYEVLKSTYNVGTNIKNYNNEIGIPLSVIGSTTGGKSLIKWLGIFIKAVSLIVFKNKNYPEMLVLEFGADKPGDIKYLCSLVDVKVGVVTAVSEAHLEFYENIDQLAKEKSDIIAALPENGYAVLNSDDPRVLTMASQTKAQVITFGTQVGAKIQASNIELLQDNFSIKGLSFDVTYENFTENFLMPKVFGKHFISSALSAIAVGSIYNIDLITISKVLRDFETPPGRMKVLPGIKNTTLVDDTYNSSPAAAFQAVLMLAELQAKNKKYAVLGDMLELGSQSEQLHQNLGQLVWQNKIDYLITVGEKSRDIARGAIAVGMNKDNISSFAASKEAGLFLQQRMKQGDLILIKGSRRIGMEKIVKEVMAQPEKAKELLVN